MTKAHSEYFIRQRVQYLNSFHDKRHFKPLSETIKIVLAYQPKSRNKYLFYRFNLLILEDFIRKVRRNLEMTDI